jgi:hypothetical protein
VEYFLELTEDNAGLALVGNGDFFIAVEKLGLVDKFAIFSPSFGRES